MHFYDKDDRMKMVFIKSLLAHVNGVYVIGLKARPSFNSIMSDHTLIQILKNTLNRKSIIIAYQCFFYPGQVRLPLMTLLHRFQVLAASASR